MNYYNEDGVIWAIDICDVHEKLSEEYKKALDEEGSVLFTVPMMNELSKDLASFDKNKGKNLCFMEPPSIDSRIVNQYALFSVINDSSIDVIDWLSSNNEVKSLKITIPSKIKWEIRDKLDQANINERIIFPGLDGLSQWLKRHYKNLTSK